MDEALAGWLICRWWDVVGETLRIWWSWSIRAGKGGHHDIYWVGVALQHGTLEEGQIPSLLSHVQSFQTCPPVV